ncbi:MAG: P-II family nitrogen regulator [Gemmatimonadetes bacterium]|jgi:nitrogen regulatory protein P-II 1|nr:P-II family nitrogen regulator [Gemmatimonadota bacterium]MBT4610698.1 P-II family nitrogen regulator [Gemmatimonadota bacterium]MBT5054980.1 P-II family nitrogen regulator [Gemmatimonadota bacterium]MBT5145049.1 P-II family nitrogen regulator [Gemmatimonadota bacterium]MBT5592102.1 P-II family nitrogen regulator [Gemmatimonadota bacterium]
MIKIEAFLRPAALEQVQEALAGIGIAGLSVLEVRGYGRQRGHREVYRGAEYTVDFVPKIKVEVAVNDDVKQQAIDAIVEAAKTGQVGDGKVFVVPVNEAVRVRTGETGDSAL